MGAGDLYGISLSQMRRSRFFGVHAMKVSQPVKTCATERLLLILNAQFVKVGWKLLFTCYGRAKLHKISRGWDL
jgi:hypothetical protein